MSASLQRLWYVTADGKSSKFFTKEDVEEIRDLAGTRSPYVLLFRLKAGTLIWATRLPTLEGQFFELSGDRLERELDRSMVKSDAGPIPTQANREKDPPETPAKPTALQTATSSPPPHGAPGTTKKPKRSTERGEGRAKLVAALTMHHSYGDGGRLTLKPIGNNELARAAEVSPSTASNFFKREFQGLTKYKAVCRDAGRLADALKVLNGEFSPLSLYGRRPAYEGDSDDE